VGAHAQAIAQLAAIYTRISRDDGSQSSTARQERLCRAWVAKRGWVTAGVYEDVDSSAYSHAVVRDAYEALLMEVAARRVDVVVCWRLDRLARSPGEFERFWSACQTAGVQVASVTEPVDSSTPTGIALVRMLVTFAGMESDAKSSRLRAKNRELAERGSPPSGTIPYGLTPGCTEIVEHEAMLIREAVARVLDGEGCVLIARDWAARGVLNRHGRPWSPQGLRNVLEGRAICGDRTYRGELVAEGCWPAIIDPMTGAQLRLRLVGVSSRLDAQRPDHLLRGLLRCGLCGEKLSARRGRRTITSQGLVGGWRRNSYFQCGYCRHVSTTRDATEDWVTETVLARIESRHSGNHRVRYPRQAASEVIAALGKRADALHELNRAYLMRGELTHTEWLRARDALLLECHQHIARASPQPKPRGLPPRVPIWKARLVWPELSIPARREVLGVELAWVIVHPPPIDTRGWSSERLEFVWVQPDPIEPVATSTSGRLRAPRWTQGTAPRPSAAVVSIAELRERGGPLVIVEACRLTGRSVPAINAARRKGRLDGKFIDGYWRYEIDELDRWQHRAQARPIAAPTTDSLLSGIEAARVLGLNDLAFAALLAERTLTPSLVTTEGQWFDLAHIRRCKLESSSQLPGPHR
jgi:site-specific DNA recombinase